MHITLELPWSADRTIQQMGRPPANAAVVVAALRAARQPIGGNQRFATSVVKKLASLGALTQGDRRATGIAKGWGCFNLDTKHGREALIDIYHHAAAAQPRGRRRRRARRTGPSSRRRGSRDFEAARSSGSSRRTQRLVGVDLDDDYDVLDRVSDDLRTRIEAAAPPPAAAGYGSHDDDDAPMGDADAVEAATRAHVAQCDALVAARVWLNLVGVDVENLGTKEFRRGGPLQLVAPVPQPLLGLEVDRQQTIFDYFASYLDVIIKNAKRDGAFDHGVLELRGRSIAVHSEQRVDCRTPADVPIAVHHLKVDRGVSWDEANRILAEAGGDQDAAARAEQVEESADGMTVWRLSNRQKMFGERDGLYDRHEQRGGGRRPRHHRHREGDASVRGRRSNLFRESVRVAASRARARDDVARARARAPRTRARRARATHARAASRRRLRADRPRNGSDTMSWNDLSIGGYRRVSRSIRRTRQADRCLQKRSGTSSSRSRPAAPRGTPTITS